MKLILYPRLCTRSRRAIRRKTKKYGHPYHYRPREDLRPYSLRWSLTVTR